MLYYSIVGLVFIALLCTFIKICPDKSILIVYNRYGRKDIVKALTKGCTLVIPFLQSSMKLFSEPVTVSMEVYDVEFKNEEKLNLSFIYTVAFPLKEDYLQNAVNNSFFIMTSNFEKKLKLLMHSKLENSVRKISISPRENEKLFMQKLNYDLENDLFNIGLEIRESFCNIVDKENE